MYQAQHWEWHLTGTILHFTGMYTHHTEVYIFMYEISVCAKCGQWIACSLTLTQLREPRNCDGREGPLAKCEARMQSTKLGCEARVRSAKLGCEVRTSHFAS